MRGDEGRSVGQFDDTPDGGGADAVNEWFGGHGDGRWAGSVVLVISRK